MKDFVFLFLMLFAGGTRVKAEILDSTQFVAFYNYVIQTQNDEGHDVSDTTRLVLLIGTRATYCTTIFDYNHDGRISEEMMNAFLMHFQNVLTDLEKSEVTTYEPLYPYRYETHSPLNNISWNLTNDSLTINGLFCHRATGKLYGKQWTVWFTEDIPSSAGPWKLRGLPGLIVMAEDVDGIHSFLLYDTKKEIKEIYSFITPDYQKITRKELMKYKKKVLGNPRYIKDPVYYVTEQPEDFGEIRHNGKIYYSANHMLIPQKAHVYQPLELE